MTSHEKMTGKELFTEDNRKKLLDLLFTTSAAPERRQSEYDPELLYVECQICGKPVLWEQGKTTELLLAAGVDTSRLDERCMIVSEGCLACQPSPEQGFTLAVVRIAGLTPEEAMYMTRPGGTA